MLRWKTDNSVIKAKRKSGEESNRSLDSKRLAVENVLNRALAFKALSSKRQLMLREMQEKDILDGKGPWTNPVYWQRFGEMTRSLFGKMA
jgi:hypothetical protein